MKIRARDVIETLDRARRIRNLLRNKVQAAGYMRAYAEYLISGDIEQAGNLVEGNFVPMPVLTRVFDTLMSTEHLAADVVVVPRDLTGSIDPDTILDNTRQFALDSAVFVLEDGDRYPVVAMTFGTPIGHGPLSFGVFDFGDSGIMHTVRNPESLPIPSAGETTEVTAAVDRTLRALSLPLSGNVTLDITPANERALRRAGVSWLWLAGAS